MVVGVFAFAAPRTQLFASSFYTQPGLRADGAMLVSGHLVTPAGTQTTLGNLPMNAVLSPNGRSLLIANSGARSPESLQVYSTAQRRITQTLPYAAPDGVVFGLAFSPSGKTAYASGGGKDTIHTYTVDRGGLLTPSGDIAVGPGDGSAFPLGIAVTPDGSLLMSANDAANTVSVIDTSTQQVVCTIPVGHYPYTVAVAPNGKRAYVTNWDDASVSVINVTAVAGALSARGNNQGSTVGPMRVSGAVVRTIPVGKHPTAMAFSPGGTTLYVADANSDAISVVDTASAAVVRTISVSPYRAAPLSSSPVSLALSPNGSTLFAANAGENAVVAIDTASGIVAGRIPTAWYPSSVVVSPRGDTMWVTNAKGLGGGPNDAPATSPNPTRKVGQGPFAVPGGYCNCSQSQYTGSSINGTLSRVAIPDLARLHIYTAQVASNNHVGDPRLLQRSPGNPIPVPGGTSPFKHVIYIDKENRTYDQVFGDVPGSNADPNLVLFGRRVTPNLHAIGDRFGLLDNFYADAEVSADGHNWINGAYASDYNQKMWPQDYSQGAGRNRGYDFEGDSRVNLNPGGYLWDAAHEAGISYRDYGNFYISPGASYLRKRVTVLPESRAARCPGPVAHSYLFKGLTIPAGAVLCLPAERVNAATVPNLVGHFDPRYRTFDQNYPEADRFAEWQREFNGFVRNRKLPALELLRFPNDHTSGTRVGQRTPQAYVAENDLAVGAVVDAVSHSPYWKDTLIVVTEDDAQNGPDHVDGHRTTSLIISAYNRHAGVTVDHTLYDTAAMVRTIELVLGLRPLSQYDAQATPMWRLFGATPDLTPYEALPEAIAPTTLNTPASFGATVAAHLDLTRADRAFAGTLNRLIWGSVKGSDSSYPVSHYSAAAGDSR